MKKIFAILMTICLMVTALSVASLVAFAAEATEDAPASGTVVLRVSALKKNVTTPVVLGDYSNFEDGWNYAMGLAGDTDDMKVNGYDRIVVDFYADWIATGSFTDDWINGDGFKNDTIYIPDDAKVTLNLKGHTINRGLTSLLIDGEVIYIDKDADVIIKDGTVKGGYSESGAGGIHIKSGANVTLENVNIVGNTADDDDGAGIALYGATLTMKGGSFQNNILRGPTFDCYGGAIYVNNSTATFNGVTFKDNVTKDDNGYGAAIYADNSTVTINECIFDGNGIKNDAEKVLAAIDTIHAENSTVNIKKSTFTKNGAFHADTHTDANGAVNMSNFSSLITLDDGSTLTVDGGCTFSNNAAYSIIRTTDDDKFYVSNSTFTNNASMVLTSNSHSDNSFFRNCVFNNNKSPNAKYPYSFNVFWNVVTFYDCDLGDSRFNKNYTDLFKCVSSTVSEAEAVISVKALFEDGTVASTSYYKDFKGGWNAAMDLAVTGAYDRIVVDLRANWNADAAHQFGLGSGFACGAILFPENVSVTLNLNGYTLNRGYERATYDGEVLYVSKNADVIINGGTVTGGYSVDGAGGIHIKDGARVVLNDVNVVNNKVNGSNGAAVAVYNGAVFVMNGGSLSDSFMDKAMYINYAYGTLYVYDATATLNNVTISNNYTDNKNSEGVAIYAEDSVVTLKNCVVSSNGTTEKGCYAESIIGADNSTLIINNTDFTGNGAVSSTDDIDYSHLFYLLGGRLTMEGGNIKNNAADKLFYFEQNLAKLNNVTVTDNASVVLDVENGAEKVTLTKCTLGNNTPVKYDVDILVDTKGTLTVNDCTLGDTTFEDKSMVTFSDNAVGSVFGEGSLTMIVSIVALIASIAAIVVNVSAKKKSVPSVVSNATENDDEE